MNILVIGNGFDLAHGLPTHYKDFLDFCGRVRRIFENFILSVDTYKLVCINDWEMDNCIKDILVNAFEGRAYAKKDNKIENQHNEHVTFNDVLNEFYDNISDNTWITYFLFFSSHIGSNWVDFETEISSVIKCLNEARTLIRGGSSVTEMQDEQKIILGNIHKSSKKKMSVEFEEIFKNIRSIDNFVVFLNKELERLIRGLEIYIAKAVGDIKITEKIAAIDKLAPDHVLSFNYSDTYEKVYGKGDIVYDYIHGKADVSKDVASCNLVLGINEYLDDERKDKEVEFISFKKFYQRIYKGTGCNYRNWVDEIRESRSAIEANLRNEFPIQIPFYKFPDNMRHNLYIFGHSLDVTDKDVLRDLILNDNVYTVIYYYSVDGTDRSDLGTKIANLIKVIGQDELIRRTGGSTRTIEFRQQDMVG